MEIIDLNIELKKKYQTKMTKCTTVIKTRSVEQKIRNIERQKEQKYPWVLPYVEMENSL